MHFKETKTVLWPGLVQRLRLCMDDIMGAVAFPLYDLMCPLMLLCGAFRDVSIHKNMHIKYFSPVWFF